MELKMIAAVGKNNELGKDNDLIWPIKEDLKFFKNVTTGHTVIMGANTFFSLPKVLPNRTNIVLSQDDITVPEGVILYHDLNKFLSDYKDKDEIVFVIGGGTIYRLFIDKVNEIYLNLTTIDKKTYNVIKNVPNRITEQEKVKLYFDDYITKAIYYSEEAYNNINEEYKSKKYDTIEKYKTYLNENRQTLLNSEQKGIKSYAVKKYADYEQYVCVDNYDNYYIFNVQGAMSYNIILDTYTVDLPQFVEKYNKASDKEKAILNIKKIFQAINLKDYNYVYNKLDTDFKNRYFKQESEFEKFADSNFFSKNEITIKEYEQIQNTHVFTVSVKNAEDKNANTKDKKIIMQLKEGTEYVMSFSVN